MAGSWYKTDMTGWQAELLKPGDSEYDRRASLLERGWTVAPSKSDDILRNYAAIGKPAFALSPDIRYRLRSATGDMLYARTVGGGFFTYGSKPFMFWYPKGLDALRNIARGDIAWFAKEGISYETLIAGIRAAIKLVPYNEHKMFMPQVNEQVLNRGFIYAKHYNKYWVGNYLKHWLQEHGDLESLIVYQAIVG